MSILGQDKASSLGVNVRWSYCWWHVTHDEDQTITKAHHEPKAQGHHEPKAQITMSPRLKKAKCLNTLHCSVPNIQQKVTTHLRSSNIHFMWLQFDNLTAMLFSGFCWRHKMALRRYLKRRICVLNKTIDEQKSGKYLFQWLRSILRKHKWELQNFWQNTLENKNRAQNANQMICRN